MAYTTGSTFSLQTGYNIPPLIYPANGMTSSTRTGGIVSSSDPYTANITSSFLTDISNMTITAEQQDLGASTIVTVTSSMQEGSGGDYLYNLTCAFMGDSLKQSKNYIDIIRSSAELTDLRLFVTNWYNETVNYTSSGFYFINYKTNSIPRHI